LASNVISDCILYCFFPFTPRADCPDHPVVRQVTWWSDVSFAFTIAGGSFIGDLLISVSNDTFIHQGSVMS
jgi:hypothetical protein